MPSPITWPLKADPSGFKAGLDSASASAKAFGSVLQGVGVGVGIKLFDGIVAGAKLVPGALMDATKSAVALGGQLVNLHAKTGVSIEGLQKLGYAAKLNGSDIDTAAKSVNAFQKNLATGSSSAAAGLKALGLSGAELRNMLPEDAFVKTADAIKSIKNPTDQAALAMTLFGKAGIEMLPAIKAGLGDAAKEAERLGFIMSSKTANAADQLGSSVDTMMMTFKGLGQNIASVVVENKALHVAVAGITNIMADLSKMIHGNKAVLSDWVTSGVKFAVQALQLLVLGADAVRGSWHTMTSAIRSARMMAIEGQIKLEQGTKSEMASTAPVFALKKQLAELRAEQKQADASFDKGSQVVQNLHMKFDDLARSVEGARGKTAGLSNEAFKLSAGLDLVAEKASKADAQLQKLKDKANYAAKEAAKPQLVLPEGYYRNRIPGASALMHGAEMRSQQILQGQGGLILPPGYQKWQADKRQANKDAVAQKGGFVDAFAMDVPKEFAKGAGDATKVTFDWNKALQAVANTMQVLGISADSMFAKVVGGMTAAASAGQQFNSAIRGSDGKFKKFSEMDHAGMIQSGASGAASFKSATDHRSAKKRAIGGGLSTGMMAYNSTQGMDPMSRAIIVGGATIAGAVVGAARKPGWVKQAEEAMRDYGVNISDELARSMEENGKKLGVGRREASLLSLVGIADEGGKEMRAFAKDVDALMVGVANGSVPAKEGLAAIGQQFQVMRDEAQLAGRVGDKAMVGMLKRARELGQVTPEMKAAVEASLGMATQGAEKFMSAFAKLGDGTKVSATAAATSFMATFNAVVAEKGIMGAAQQLGKGFEDFRKKMGEIGGEAATAILGPMSAIFDLTQGPMGGLVELVDGLRMMMIGTADAGYLSVDAFTAMQTTARGAFDDMIAGGVDSSVAIQALAPTIQAAVSAAEQFGIPLSADMEYLKGIAEQNGIAFQTDPMNRAANAMEDVARSLEKVAAFAISAANGFTFMAQQALIAAAASHQIKAPGGGGGYVPSNDTGGGGYVPSNDTGGGVPGKDYEVPGHASGTISTKPHLAMIHGSPGNPEIVGTLSDITAGIAHGSAIAGGDDELLEDIRNLLLNLPRTMQRAMRDGGQLS